MASEFKFPDVGEGIHEGEIVKWHVKEGDSVKQDETLVEVETDKAIVSIPSPRKGIILKLNVFTGTIKVGNILCVIGDKGEKYVPTASAETKPQEKKASVTVMGELPETKEESKKEVSKIAQVKARFATRQLAKQLGVDIFAVKGTGQDGLITDDDIHKAASQLKHPTISQVHPAHPDALRVHVPKITAPLPQNVGLKVQKDEDEYGKVERHPLKGIRKTIADNMVKSFFTAPHVTHMDEADVTDLYSVVQEAKKKAEKKKIHLTYLPFVVQALVEALKKHPSLNASLDDHTSEIIYKKYYNFGIAVDSEAGLMVPIVKNVDKKGLLQLAKEIAAIADKCRDRTITLDELKGGTISITNIGAFGGIFATPIIHQPEVANIGLFRIKDQPRVIVVKEGKENVSKIVIRKIMPLTVAFDHRVIDGGEAARFMNDLKYYLENPKVLFKKVE